MFNIANHYKNVNQNYQEVLPHTSQNDHHLKNNYKEQVLERVQRKGNPPIPLWECKLVQALWKTVWRFLKKLKVQLHMILHSLGIYPNKTVIQIQKDAFTPIFTAALFTTAKTWKESKCLQTDEWIKKVWYISTMKYYLATKNEIMLFCSNTYEPRDCHTKTKTNII